MRAKNLFAPTRRERPAGVDSISNGLLLRAGFIHQEASGIFNYLPLMHRILTKVETIVREEMTKQAAQEVRMPILQRRELWEESHRWESYVTSGTMFHLKDRKGNELALGPTHEEVVSDIVRATVTTYRQ